MSYLNQLFSVAGKTALVTGAATGIGRMAATGLVMAGANVLMPNITDTKYREGYQLYEGKPCLDENADQCIGCLKRRIESIGESIGFDEWGDSKHFAARIKKQ